MPKIPVLIILCFRPLSGNYISQFFVLSTMGKLGQGFRPLSGNYISQYCASLYYERGIHCFRPLSGNYISQCITITVKEILDNVSVPCRGTTFLNMYHLEYHILLFCFRPLSGNYISQYCASYNG